jgi:hypothetical protein
VAAKPEGGVALSAEGFLFLPAALRQRYRIDRGEPLLVASLPDRHLVIICPPAVIDQMTVSFFSFLR